MRARDFAIPSAEDLAQAEAELQLVRRGYVPQTPLAGAAAPARPRRS